MKQYLINWALYALYNVNDAADSAQDWLFRLERKLQEKEKSK
jgi:hypothetical protein